MRNRERFPHDRENIAGESVFSHNRAFLSTIESIKRPRHSKTQKIKSGNHFNLFESRSNAWGTPTNPDPSYDDRADHEALSKSAHKKEVFKISRTNALEINIHFSQAHRWIIRLLCSLIILYRYTLSFLFGRQCRHWPTCSQYTTLALTRHGAWPGLWISLARLCRCHPWGTWGIDCVPTLLPPHAAYYRPWTYGRWRGTNSPQPSEEKNTVGSPTIALTFPDGASREYPKGITGFEVVKSISPSLAKKTALMAIDGTLRDLNDSLHNPGTISFLKRDDTTLLATLRHDCAHILAEAVQTLYPGTQVTIGPAIENGFYYDFYRDTPFTPEDLPKIEAEMRKIIARDEPFVKEVWTREQALEWFKKKGESFKCELIESIPGTEDLTIYRQGTWLDLCRGPHMRSTGQVGHAFTLTHVAGAYWRGDPKRATLTRIYGTAFASQEALDAYLKQREEAEKRDHRRLGREMDLFHFQEEGPGTVFWHPKGWSLFQTLIAYMRRQQERNGYKEVNTPQLLDRVLWEKSGHWEKFHDHMFITHTDDERCFALKPMNCPGHVHIFRQGSKSYRDLPERICEFGIVHRYEPSGAIHGLMRVRAFTQDDAHIFCAEDQLFDEGRAANALLLAIYKDFGFSNILIKLSTRPEKRIGSDSVWDKAEEALRHILRSVSENPPEGCTIHTQVNPGEGAFYGPKLEYVLKDAIGREWQCGTLQLDFNLPGRLDAVYTDRDGIKKHPVMLHRALFGSLERFTGILIEHFAGHLPLWLSPIQGVVCSITDEVAQYAEGVCALAKERGLKFVSDVRNEKISYKVREHMSAKAPIILVVGHRERDEQLVTLRRLGSPDSTTYPLQDALDRLAAEACPPDLK